MSESKGKRVRATVRIPVSLKRQLEAKAQAAGVNVNSFIVELLDRMVRAQTAEQKDHL
jgi:predicted HicB family RNase H-like nuclease